MDAFELEAKPRTGTGRSANRRLRRSNWVPAIVYGGGGEPSKIALEHDDLSHHLDNEAFFSHIIRIKIEGGHTEDAILRDLQRHPARPFVEHADFQRVVADKALRMSVPLHFTGADECPGVVEDNAIVEHSLNEVEIECLPKDLPEYIEIDCGNLRVHDTVHLSELAMPANVSLVALMGEASDEETDQLVLTVSLPRAEVEPEEEEAEGEAEQAAAETAEAGDGSDASDAGESGSDNA